MTPIRIPRHFFLLLLPRWQKLFLALLYLRASHWPLCLALWGPHPALTCLLSRLIFGTFRRGPRVKHSLTAHLILDIILPQSEGLLYTLGSLSVAIVGAGNIQHMLVTLKILNVRNVVVFIELRTTDCWLDIARPIPSLTILGRRLQLVHLALTLSSIWIARGITLLTTTSVPSGAIALTSSGKPIRLLRGALEEQTTALSMAPVKVVNENV